MADQVLAPSFHQIGPYACDGTQHDNSFVLDYNNPAYIRYVVIAILGDTPGQYGTITLSMDVVNPGGCYLIAAVTGEEAGCHENFGGNSIPVPAGQALAFEWSGFGGGNRSFNATVFYSANP